MTRLLAPFVAFLRIVRGAPDQEASNLAKTTEAAAKAAKAPSGADIERASEFVREPILLDGEGPRRWRRGPPAAAPSTPP